MAFEIVAVCRSREKGVQKRPMDEARFVAEWGIEGDAHAGKWHRQVTLLAEEVARPAWKRVARSRPEVYLGPGAFGENILTRGMDWNRVSIGQTIRIGEVELEITQLGKPLHQENAILRVTGESVLPDHGIFARVVRGGVVNAGHSGYHHI